MSSKHSGTLVPMESFSGGTDEVSLEMDELVLEMDDKMVLSLDGFDWEEAGKSFQNAILLKLSTGRAFRKNSMTEIIDKVWKISQPATYEMVENNLMLVNFGTKEDQEKVLSGGPWTLDGTAIILQKWEQGMVAEDFSNTGINIFVQVHGLPFELRKDKYARKFAALTGKVLYHKANGEVIESRKGGEFVNYRVRLDTSKPVRPGYFLRRRNRKPIWVSFKYVKLPTVCFKCGRLNHDTKTCKERVINQDKCFGVWLRAESDVDYVPDWTEHLGRENRKEDGGGVLEASDGEEGVEEQSRLENTKSQDLDLNEKPTQEIRDSPMVLEKGTVRDFCGGNCEVDFRIREVTEVQNVVRKEGVGWANIDEMAHDNGPREGEFAGKGKMSDGAGPNRKVGLRQKKRLWVKDGEIAVEPRGEKRTKIDGGVGETSVSRVIRGKGEGREDDAGVLNFSDDLSAGAAEQPCRGK